MRVLVFFDLPVETRKNRKDYRTFRNYLLKSGFMMIQESVYCKLALNGSNVTSILTGSYTSELLDTDERLVII